MNSKEFFKKIFNTGIATDEEIIKFMIKNYFLKGYTLEDFENDIVLKHGKSEVYARALKEDFKKHLESWSR